MPGVLIRAVLAGRMEEVGRRESEPEGCVSPWVRVEKMEKQRCETKSEMSLTPLATVSLGVKTGKRRVIEYFLSPLLQRGSESLRER